MTYKVSKINLNDVRHFNTLPHMWQLIAKHVDNNGRKRPIILRNLWLLGLAIRVGGSSSC